MWQQSRPRSERVDESSEDTSIETRSDLSSMMVNNEEEEAKLDLILNPKNQNGEEIDQ
jgi:hypothetical protein